MTIRNKIEAELLATCPTILLNISMGQNENEVFVSEFARLQELISIEKLESPCYFPLLANARKLGIID